MATIAITVDDATVLKVTEAVGHNFAFKDEIGNPRVATIAEVKDAMRKVLGNWVLHAEAQKVAATAATPSI